MPGFFISYRRDDQAGFAGRLADALEATFGADNVFRDIEDIHPGEDFVVAIEKNLAAVDVMLVMIGPAWLSVSRHGVRRLDEPDDFVRREIEAALNSGKVVLPVLVGGAAMPAEKDLPASIAGLARRQALTLSDAGWAADVAQLVQAIGPAMPVGQRGAKRSWKMAGSIVLILVLLLLVGLKVSGPYRVGAASKQPLAAAVQQLPGNWEATVKYDWGVERPEVFKLRMENGGLYGTAGFLGVARTIEQGVLKGDQLSFVTHSQEMAGDGPARELTHRYRGVLQAGELHLTLETTGGISAHTPVSFIARRANGQ